MHAHDEHLFVVGAVEDADLAARRHPLRVAPQVVVVELFGRRDLEAVHGDALRVHAAHHVPDDAVLAGGVETLDDDEQGVRFLRGKTRLAVGEELHAVLQ